MVSLILLAVGEATSDRTLVVVSIISSVTTLGVACISALVSYMNSKKLAIVAELPKKVEEFRKEVDGRMTELRESRMETSEARQEVARGEGMQQERIEERQRLAGTQAEDVAKMEIVNPEIRPVIPGEKKSSDL